MVRVIFTPRGENLGPWAEELLVQVQQLRMSSKMEAIATMMVMLKKNQEESNAMFLKLTQVVAEVRQEDSPPLRRSPRHHAAKRNKRKRSPPNSRKKRSPPRGKKKTSTKKTRRAKGTPVQRTLSYSSSDGSARKRQKKTPEAQTLRKQLVTKLYRFDVDLFNGHYTLPDGTFNRTLFEDDAETVVAGVIGDEYTDDELPNEAMTIARDIAKRRRRYLRNHPGKVKSFEVVDLADGSSSGDDEDTPKRTRKVKKEPVADAHEPTEDDVERCFETDGEDEDKQSECCVWECLDCQKKMTDVEECYPKHQRENGILFRCRDCYNGKRQFFLAMDKGCQLGRKQDKEMLDAKKQEMANDKKNDKKKQAEAAQQVSPPDEVAPNKPETAQQVSPPKEVAPNKPAATKAKVAATRRNKRAAKTKTAKKEAKKTPLKADKKVSPKKRKPKYAYKYMLQANVMAMWEDGEFYRAQIYARRMGQYNVYFPQDGEQMKSVPEANIRKADSKKDPRNVMRRSEFLQLEFKHKLHVKNTPKLLGDYKVVSMGKGVKKVNQYVCKLDGDEKEYLFDMGYVQDILLRQVFPLLYL